MGDLDPLAGQFESHRTHLRAVGYRMLGSISDADDAVQEAWLRASKAGTEGVDNIAGWLTTIVARVSLNMLRSRGARGEQALDIHMPDPIVSSVDGVDPEHEAMLTDSVGLALLVVLDALAPDERLAFVLHDMFAVPFSDVATILDKSPAATRQLASRARRRVKDAGPMPDVDLARQREVVDAFFAASRDGDFDGLVAVLDPDVVLRSDGGTGRSIATMVIRGGTTVAGQAVSFGQLTPFVRPALVNGAAGVVVAPRDQPVSIMGFVVRAGRIVAIDVLADPDRLHDLDLSAWWR